MYRTSNERSKFPFVSISAKEDFERVDGGLTRTAVKVLGIIGIGFLNAFLFTFLSSALSGLFLVMYDNY